MGLTHNIKQFSQKPISDIIGLTHNIKQFSQKPISDIIGLTHIIKQFSLKPISDIMGLTHNIKQFSQKPISDIIGLTHNIKQFSLKPISNIMGVRTGIILNTSYNNLYFGFLENQNLLLYMQQNQSNLLLAQSSILPVLAGNFQNPFTLYHFLKKCNQTACLL